MTLSRPLLAFLFLISLVLIGPAAEAHKPITSPYTYNEDVYPILADKCGRCHVAGGVAPMSLLTYKDAVPWGESIRAELVAGHMPPWAAIGGSGRFKNAQKLTARELNVLLTWVTGGTPVGNAEQTPAPGEVKREWLLGPPDLQLHLTPEFALAADTSDATHEFTVPTNLTETRWIRSVDLLPGTPAIVRDARITVAGSHEEQGPGLAPQRLLSLWVPGEDPVALDDRNGFQLPPGSTLKVRVHYRKTWQYERQAMTDRSVVGVYFAPSATRAVRALTLAPSTAPSPPGALVSFGKTVDEDLQAVAVYPEQALLDSIVRLQATKPDGARVEMIRLSSQSDWSRRYWFDPPILLPRGTRIEAVASRDEALTLLAAVPTPPPKSDRDSSVRLVLDVVPVH